MLFQTPSADKMAEITIPMVSEMVTREMVTAATLDPETMVKNLENLKEKIILLPLNMTPITVEMYA